MKHICNFSVRIRYETPRDHLFFTVIGVFRVIANFVDAELLDDDTDAYKNYDIANEKMKPIIDKFENKTKKKKEPEPKGLEKFTE